MANRNMKRVSAKREYDLFTRLYKDQLRGSGQYGKPGRRVPTFAQWFAWKQSQNAVIPLQQQPELTVDDPWAEPMPVAPATPVEDSGRGVVTMDMKTGANE